MCRFCEAWNGRYHFGHAFIDAEHLRLGLLRAVEGRAITILFALGCDPIEIYKALEKTMGRQKTRPRHHPPDQNLDIVIRGCA